MNLSTEICRVRSAFADPSTRKVAVLFALGDILALIGVLVGIALRNWYTLPVVAAVLTVYAIAFYVLKFLVQSGRIRVVPVSDVTEEFDEEEEPADDQSAQCYFTDDEEL